MQTIYCQSFQYRPQLALVPTERVHGYDALDLDLIGIPTNVLDHDADIAKVQEWLGHANIATTRIYDHRKTRPDDSPTFKVVY
jgi:hypothetical protein